MKTRTLDCVEMKRRGAEYVHSITKDMTPAEEVEYWRKRTTELRQEQERVRSQPDVPPTSVSGR